MVKGNAIGFFLPVANVLASRKTATTPEAKVSKAELGLGRLADLCSCRIFTKV
jgi:hypothetical protein